MDEKWIEEKFININSRIDELKILMKNHLEHHFIFTMTLIAVIGGLVVVLWKFVP